jgi:hypothetical protein
VEDSDKEETEEAAKEGNGEKAEEGEGESKAKEEEAGTPESGAVAVAYQLPKKKTARPAKEE